MRGTFAALVLLLASCSQSPAGLVLVFQSDADRMKAASAEIQIVRAQGDMCPTYLVANDVGTTPEFSVTVGLTNGVPSRSLTGVPTGSQTVLIKILDTVGNIALHGCKTGNLSSGVTFEVTITSLTAPPDMAMNDGSGPVDDLSIPPPDMAVHHFLTVFVPELRLNSRKLNGVAVTVTDSANATLMATSDATGSVKLDVTALVPPFTITGNAPLTNGYQGAVTLQGVTPSFTSNPNAALNMPIELDPPSPSPAAVITATVSGSPAGNFTLYWVDTNGLGSDPVPSVNFSGAAMATSPGLVMSSSFRVAVTDNPVTKISTPGPVSGFGNFTATNFVNFGTTFTLTSAPSANAAAYPTQNYAINLVLPAAPNQAPIPIVPPTTNTAGPHPAMVPGQPSAVQPSAFLLVEETADGPAAHAELRQQLSLPNTQPAVTLAAVADPPIVMASPSPLPSTQSFTVTATPPVSFPFAAAYVHIIIHDAGNFYRWHVIAPAANPTNITLPANLIPPGSYNMDVAFVLTLLTPADGTVPATLADDYTKLTRPLPKQLNQSTISLTVN